MPKRLLEYTALVNRCRACNAPLTPPKKAWCSERCRKANGNKQFQSYVAQQARGLKRKIMLISLRGGSCEACGYERNAAALNFHHVGPKAFDLGIRSLSNQSEEAMMKEFAQCILLCANCHAEHHHPDLDLVAMRGFAPTDKPDYEPSVL